MIGGGRVVLTSASFPVAATRIATLVAVLSTVFPTVFRATLIAILSASSATGPAAGFLAVLTTTPAAIRVWLLWSWWLLTEGRSLQVICD